MLSVMRLQLHISACVGCECCAGVLHYEVGKVAFVDRPRRESGTAVAQAYARPYVLVLHS